MFQVAVVGQAVVATVGDVVAYGVGPGTEGSNYKKKQIFEYESRLSNE